ncbi:MAG TPA: GAF domain-containing protein, partial [Anaerolineales bacterium]|nr:GAF domain-containing protein [Anaerolineales bacterium]
SGEGINRGAIGLVFIGGYAIAAMPRSIRGRLLLTSLLVGAGIVLLDVIGPAGRPEVPQSPAQIIFTLFTIFIFSFFIAREFPNLDLRTKISFGILVTGGVAVGVISFFAISQSSQLINSLSNRVEVSVNLLAEEQLINTVSNEANRANTLFQSAITQTTSLANQLDLFQEQKNTLGDGTYWNAANGMLQLSEGQYTSRALSQRSVFIPSNVEFDESVIRELNVTAYLDFSAPFVLENNTQITALYYTTVDGIITYYPNINLGVDLPHDFDATEQPTFRVATPLFSPDKTSRWAFPRQDPTGGVGLVTSLSSPVYFKDEFKGVMTADFKLDKIAEDINTIKVGSTGYAFLVDNEGHIIAMSAAGYEFFGLQPEILEVNQEPQQTIFDGDNPLEIQQITRRMVVGGSGLIATNVKGSDTFIAYAPVAGNEFSLGVIVPVAELTQPVSATRNEINAQVQIALRSAALILIILLASAILVSLGLGQLISAPLLRLTNTANQILEGNLSAQAKITTKDETGTLAKAFNEMTSQLSETLAGLERTINERTSELSIASQNNERRAKQFQSISQVARTISSTLDFDNLLTQITTVISREFGFYHVGVFLLDTAREFAVLSAANSEGGQTMLTRGHRLKVGEKGLVGFVSSTGRPRVALDTGADAIYFNNPDLPSTRSEIALPLRAGEKIIGVLDVQSTEPNAFSEDDIVILSTLADQVTIAIQNARQNEQTQKALAESDALSRQFVQTGWEQFTRKQKILGVRHTGAKSILLYSKGKNQADQEQDQLKPKGRGAVLSIPIKLRGEVIGSVDVQAPDNRKWDQDEMDIVTAIIERAAIAMENSRLLSESQKRAAKERTIGEISTKISAKSEVEDLLKTAAQELSRTLPGTEIAIQFAKDKAE